MSKFWDDKSIEPKRAFRWYMTFGGSDSNTIETYAIKSVKKPSFAVSEVPHQYGAHTFYFPGRVTWNTIDVTLVDPVQPDHSAILTNMFVDAGYQIPTQASKDMSLSKEQFNAAIGEPTIVQIDAAGHWIEKWHLHNAFFTSVDFGQLDYGTEDLVITSMTLRYDWASFENSATVNPTSKLKSGGP